MCCLCKNWPWGPSITPTTAFWKVWIFCILQITERVKVFSGSDRNISNSSSKAWDNPLWWLWVERCQKVKGEWKLRFITFKVDFWPGRWMAAFFWADLQAKWIPGLTSELGGFHKGRNLPIGVTHGNSQALQDWSCGHFNLEEKEENPQEGG